MLLFDAGIDGTGAGMDGAGVWYWSDGHARFRFHQDSHPEGIQGSIDDLKSILDRARARIVHVQCIDICVLGLWGVRRERAGLFELWAMRRVQAIRKNKNDNNNAKQMLDMALGSIHKTVQTET